MNKNTKKDFTIAQKRRFIKAIEEAITLRKKGIHYWQSGGKCPVCIVVDDIIQGTCCDESISCPLYFSKGLANCAEYSEAISRRDAHGEYYEGGPTRAQALRAFRGVINRLKKEVAAQSKTKKKK